MWTPAIHKFVSNFDRSFVPSNCSWLAASSRYCSIASSRRPASRRARARKSLTTSTSSLVGPCSASLWWRTVWNSSVAACASLLPSNVLARVKRVYGSSGRLCRVIALGWRLVRDTVRSLRRDGRPHVERARKEVSDDQHFVVGGALLCKLVVEDGWNSSVAACASLLPSNVLARVKRVYRVVRSFVPSNCSWLAASSRYCSIASSRRPHVERAQGSL